MPDPVTIGTLAAAALAAGAGAIGKSFAGAAATDAYNALKNALMPVSEKNVTMLEAAPEAEHRARSLAEDVDDLDADTQAKIKQLAEMLRKALASEGVNHAIPQQTITVGDGSIAAGGSISVGGDLTFGPSDKSKS